MLVRHKSKFSIATFFIMKYAGWPFVFLLCFDAAVAIGFVYFHLDFLSEPDIPVSLFGSAIGVLIGFRNTGAYARWWEGRQLWGAIVNDSRTLARQATSFIAAADQGLAHEVIQLQIAYVHALRMQLRGQSVFPDLDRYLEPEVRARLGGEKNIAVAIQHRMGHLLAQSKGRGTLTDLSWMNLDDTLSRLMNSQGGLERIKNTPMPQQYDYFIRFFVGIYCLLLPFGMVEKLGLLTPIGSSLLGLTFLTLDKMGCEVETPFENTPLDLPLSSISTTIEINLRQMMNETTLPAPEVPAQGILW